MPPSTVRQLVRVTLSNTGSHCDRMSAVGSSSQGKNADRAGYEGAGTDGTTLSSVFRSVQ